MIRGTVEQTMKNVWNLISHIIFNERVRIISYFNLNQCEKQNDLKDL